MIEIVMLHHVAPKTSVHIGPRAEYVVTPDQLDAYLRRRRRWRALSGESQFRHSEVERCFLITFDDGYRNNLTDALPVLEKHEVPCILFVTTSFIDGRAYPYEIELAGVVESLPTVRLPDDTTVEARDRPAQQSLYQQLRQPLKPATHARREAVLNELARRNGYRRRDFQHEPIMDWDEVQALSRHPLVTIGAHTHTHLLLSRQWWTTAYREIRRSRDELEARLGRTVSTLSYPYGGHSWAVRRIVQACGFEYAFTTDPRRIRQVGRHNRFTLPRIDLGRFTRP